MRSYEIVITGKSPLLMHWDNLTWAGELKRWRETPENKKRGVAGDDRSPAFSWLGSLYHDGARVSMPSDNIMRCLMAGGAAVPVPGGKNGKTFKAQTQSGMLAREENWPLFIDGKEVPVKPLLALRDEADFEKHESKVVDSGFSLFVKRAAIGAAKHVRVRPRFDRWELRGSVDVWDEQITSAVLVDVFKVAGEYKGLGDWRPSSPKSPGPFGRFGATITEVR